MSTFISWHSYELSCICLVTDSPTTTTEATTTSSPTTTTQLSEEKKGAVDRSGGNGNTGWMEGLENNGDTEGRRKNRNHSSAEEGDGKERGHHHRGTDDLETKPTAKKRRHGQVSKTESETESKTESETPHSAKEIPRINLATGPPLTHIGRDYLDEGTEQLKQKIRHRKQEAEVGGDGRGNWTQEATGFWDDHRPKGHSKENHSEKKKAGKSDSKAKNLTALKKSLGNKPIN